MLRMCVRFFVVAMVVGSVCFSAPVHGENMIPDPQFKKFDYSPVEHREEWKEYWRSYQIEKPGKWSAKAGAAEITGGKTFVHSPYFGVEPGQTLQIRLSASGDGKVGVQCLYWTAEGGTAKKHRTIPIEVTAVKEEKSTLQGTDTVPEEAAEAYIRIVVEGGTVSVSEPKVTPAE